MAYRDARPGLAHSPQGHGTRACYVNGCRAAECQAANARYMAAWRGATPGYAYGKRIADRPPEHQVRRRAVNGTRPRPGE